MAKSLFLFIISLLLGVVSGSTSLMAADKVSPRSPIFTDPLTVEIKPEPAPEPANTINITSAPIYTAPANSITIAGRTIEIVNVDSTGLDAGNYVYRKDKFLYSHNSYNVFGPIVDLPEGTTFSVNTNGITKNYQVTITRRFEKNEATGQLQLNGEGSYMSYVAVAKEDKYAIPHSLAIMTCTGVSYGNGKASHRFVIFADEIK